MRWSLQQPAAMLLALLWAAACLCSCGLAAGAAGPQAQHSTGNATSSSTSSTSSSSSTSRGAQHHRYARPDADVLLPTGALRDGSGPAAGPSPRPPGGAGPLSTLYQQFQAWDDTSTGATDASGSSALLQQAQQQQEDGVAAAPREWMWASYHSHEAMLQFLEQLAANSSGTCRLEHVGDSIEGRRIVSVTIGSSQPAGQPPGELPKPNFVWIGNMHGDETANRELLLRLAAAMCSLAAPSGAQQPDGNSSSSGGSSSFAGVWGAGSSSLEAAATGAGEGVVADVVARLRALLNTTVVRIIPTMNPDGFARLQRYNAAQVDLNRNWWDDSFPYAKPRPEEAFAREETGGWAHPAAASWAQVGNFSLQPEGRAVAELLRALRPDLSANLHGGSVVANYPMDACDSLGEVDNCPTADEPLPYILALSYSTRHPTMGTWTPGGGRDGDAGRGGAGGGTGSPFRNGTVQGATWYTVLGSMQDWVYHALGRLHITLELHDSKNPPAASLPDLWAANRQPMLRLMELSHMGLRALVLDAKTRAPLRVKLTVVSPPGIRGTTADERGYLFKPMAPGLSYTFVVQPYDPSSSVSYGAVELRGLMLGASREEVLGGGGLEGLGVVRTILAEGLEQSRRKRRHS